MESQAENSEIKPGDLVRLLEPFRPERYGCQEYTFAIVAGLVRDNRKSKNHSSFSKSKQAEGYQSELDELVVYLYDLDSSTTYIDEFGVEALFSFNTDEVELYKARQIPTID